MTLPSGTVTFLLYDVERSTKAWQELPDAMPTALAALDAATDEVASAHRGARPLEQGEGDSAVLAFSSAADALRAAEELQRRLADLPFRVRAAVHTGDARAVDGKYVGLVLHRAARLKDIAHGGQVLVSQATFELVRDDFALRDLGPHRLRDLGRPERVYQLDTGEEFPPLRSLDEIPNNLPPQHTTFIGRATELDEIVSLIEGNRLVTIVGSGGCGKSRLAVQAAAQVADLFPDGVWWIDLSGVTDPAVVGSVARRALLIKEDTDDALARFLRDRTTCLVVDNCEHLLDATADLVRTLLDAGPRVHVVTTTREPIAVPGEAAWRVPSMSAEDAVRLFVERARLVRAGFAPDERVPSICERLDGIPLAIELAAARARAMSTTDIAKGLDDRFRLLTGGPRGVAARQRTLEASVDWSHDLLSDEERTLFRRLSVFAGGFSREGAEAVHGGDVLDGLTALVDRSLVVAEELVDAGTRYRMLETIRQYAYERLNASGEAAQMRDRHLAYFADICARVVPDLDNPKYRGWLTSLRADQDNFRAALEWGYSSDDDETWVSMVAALGAYWLNSANYIEALRWTERALEATQGERSERRMRLLQADGWLAGSLPDFARQARSVNAGFEVARDLGDRKWTGRFLAMRAYEQMWRDPAAGREAFRQALEIAREHDDHFWIAFSASTIGNTYFTQDRYDEAEAYIAEAEAANSIVGDPLMHLLILAGRSWIDHLRGNVREALRHGERALEIAAAEVIVPLSQSIAIAAHSWARSRMGDHEGARIALSARLETARDDGVELAVPWIQAALAETLVWLGELEEAVELIERYRSSYEAIGMGWSGVAMRMGLGTALGRLGDAEAAHSFLDEAMAWESDFDMPRARAGAFSARARISEDPHEAERLEHEALDIRWRFGINVEVPESLEMLARLAADQGRDDEAARLLAAAASAREAMGCPLPPVDRPVYDELAARLLSLPAWEEGLALSLDEAVAYATRSRGTRGRPATGWASLTPIERQVVDLVAEGLTNPQIGEKLFISKRTVQAHLARIFPKLGVSSRSELAALAARSGIS